MMVTTEATSNNSKTNINNNNRSFWHWHKRLLYELSPSYPMYCLLEEPIPFHYKNKNKNKRLQLQKRQQEEEVLPPPVPQPPPQQQQDQQQQHSQQQQQQPPRKVVNIYQCICGPYRPIITTTNAIIFSSNSNNNIIQPKFLLKLLKPFNNYVFYIRLFFLSLSCHVFYIDITKYPPHNLHVYMFFLTHWGHCINILYLFCSLLCCISFISFDISCNNATCTSSDDYDDVDGKKLPKLIKLTWSLYATAAPLSIAITLLYWIAIVPVTVLTNSNSSSTIISYVSIMEHGGIGLLVLLDGILVGTIPVRVKQYIYMLCVCIAYLLWSIINFLLNLGNGDWGPDYGDDDNLYPVLNWNNESRRVTAIISGFAILILCPIVYWSVWMLGLVSIIKRRKDGGNKEVEVEAEKADDDALLLVTTKTTKTTTTTKDGGLEGEGNIMLHKQQCCNSSFCRYCCCCFCCSCCCSNTKQTSCVVLLWEGRRRPLLLLLDDVANNNNNNNNNNTTYYYYEADDNINNNEHDGPMYNEMSDGFGGILA